MQIAHTTEIELVEASRRGERAAFGELVERCARMVDAVSYAATRDRTLSEDIVQDTFVAAWCDLGRLRDTTALRPWLCSIARNLAHKARRKRARERAVAVPDRSPATPFDLAHQHEIERVVANALARVPDVYREALVLFYFEQCSTRAVAAALGISEAAAHKRLSRGRRYLADGVDEIVATELERRRSRRNLGLCVLAALPVAPSTARAASRASPIVKLGFVAAAALALAPVAVSSPAPSSRSHHAAPVQASLADPVRGEPTAATPASIHAVTPARLPSPAPRAVAAAPRSTAGTATTCASVAQHLVTASMKGPEREAEHHPESVQRVTARFEARCAADAWSQSDFDCLLAAGDAREVDACLPDEPPEPQPAITELACTAIGAHVALLMSADLSGTRQDNIAVSVITSADDLPGEVQEECAIEQWSEPLRRCYAAATLYKQIVLCNIQLRP